MVNLFPTVLVGGPPHAGKSVLFYHLTQALRARGIPHHILRACPDGEGNWFQEGQAEHVSTILVKRDGKWPSSFVRRVSQDLEYRCLPFLVDMGGRPTESEKSLFQLCTHSVLLLRADKPDDTRHWQRIVEEYNLLPLAQIISEQNGISRITDVSPMLQGTISGLDRHQPMKEPDALFDELVERVAELFRTSNPDASKKAYVEHAPTELTLDLETGLKAFTKTSTQWELNMLPDYLESLPKQEAFSVYGSAPSWLYAALAAQAGRAPFYLFDPKLPFGWVQPVQVCIGEEISPDLSIKAEEYKEYTLLDIAFPNERLEYFQPDPLACPAVDPDKGVILYGKTPNWLLTAMVRLYQERGVPWIAPFYVRTKQAVVIYSQVKSHRAGELVAVEAR